MSSKKLHSWKDAQRQIGTILDKLNANPMFLLAAAANPLHALEELGYEISADVRQEFEDRIRFGESGAAHLHSLRESIFKLARKSFDLNSPDHLFDVLSGLLPKAHAKDLKPLEAQPLLPHILSPSKPTDPLERFQSAHRIMEPLLEYRRLEASTPRFSTRSIYDDIRQGRRKLPVTKIVARLRKSPAQ